MVISNLMAIGVVVLRMVVISFESCLLKLFLVMGKLRSHNMLVFIKIPNFLLVL